MSRAEPLLLLAWGGVTCVVALGDDLVVYVRPGVRWLVLAAGAVMVGIAALELRSVPTPAPRARPGPAWLLLVPVLVLAVVAPPPLGPLSADRPPVTPPRPGAGFPALPARGVLPMALGDVVLRTLWEHGRSLRGRTLRVVGFVVRPTGGGFVLARLVITCCAADARPYDLAIRWPSRAPPRGAWVVVTGRFRGASVRNHLVPVLAAVGVQGVAVPARPYE